MLKCFLDVRLGKITNFCRITYVFTHGVTSFMSHDKKSRLIRFRYIDKRLYCGNFSTTKGYLA